MVNASLSNDILSKSWKIRHMINTVGNLSDVVNHLLIMLC